ncbi:MAG: hypothetical protein ACKO9G_21950 [Dolichospermum sp.]
MNYEEVKKLNPPDFKRYCGVHIETFNDMAKIVHKGLFDEAIAKIQEAFDAGELSREQAIALEVNAEMLNFVTKVYIFSYGSPIKGENVNIS